MKIGICASALGKGGGMERYALDLITGFLELNHDVIAFCRKADRTAPGMERLRDLVAVSSTRLLPGKFRNIWFSRRLDRLRKALPLEAHIACCMVEHPDVAVCGGTHRGYLKASGKPPGFFDRRQIAFEAAQYRNARVIIAHSRLMRDELIDLYGIGPGKIHLLYPPANRSRFTPPTKDERQRLREEFGFRPDRKYFLFPSGGHVRKGLPFLRRFFETTDLPVELVVAGRKAEPGKNIRPLGYVGEIERLYRAVDAGVLASEYEPFGLVGVESVLSGTPFILPDTVGCGEILTKPFLFRFRKGNEDDFQAAVCAVMRLDREELPDPLTAIQYDCGIRRHAEDLLDCISP